MSRNKKLKVIVPIIILLFLGAYGRHRYLSQKITVTGRLQDKIMREISGVSTSGIQNDILYVHNDSGDTSRFFVTSPQGKLLNTIYYKGESPYVLAGAADCEDIAVGPGPVRGQSYIYVGDIGDNGMYRHHITIYRVPETNGLINGTIHTVNAQRLYLKYPKGPTDSETLMVDPIDKLFYIVTKRFDTVYVYTAPLQYRANDTIMLTKRAKLFFEGIKPFKWITAGDISKDGQQVLLKSYEKVYYWKRENNEPVWQTMLRAPREMLYETEKQGEAIGFTRDGKGYYTTSEGVFAPIYFYKTP